MASNNKMNQNPPPQDPMSASRQNVANQTRQDLYALNLVGIKTSLLASWQFNLSEIRLRINGVREMNRGLFNCLDRYGIEDQAPLFLEHMRATFDLELERKKNKKRAPTSFIRLIRGWHFDSSRPEAGVIKGWAESRFGLPTLFHIEPLGRLGSPSYNRYLYDKMHPRFHDNNVFSQLDLLYEFCQYHLDRFGPKPGRHLSLFRGTNGLGGEMAAVGQKEGGQQILRNNSVVSYSFNRERAGEFGDQILEISAPYCKILCFPQLLPQVFPPYEEEVLILGGDYLTQIHL